MNRGFKTHRAAPYLFLAPFLILLGVFIVIPLAQAIVLATRQTFGPTTSVFVGFDNFIDLASDPLFWIAVRNTTLFAAGSLLLQLPLALGLALLLNRPGLRGRAIFRLIFFAPSLVGLVFVAMIFSLIFEKRTGLLNVALHAIFPGFDLEFPWLQEYVLPAMIIASLWLFTGFNMVYFLAALQNVSRDLLDAATMDGASPWQRFRHVILPEIRPVASFVVLLSLIGSFQLFELPWVLLEGPGPENRGLTIVMYLYQIGFVTNDLGYSSAVGWALAILLAGFAILHQRLSRTEKY